MRSVTVVIPFHRNLAHLAESLAAVRRSMPKAEVLVAADGAMDDCRPLAEKWDARVLTIPGPQGPAVARNRAAAIARGDIVAFVDADVVAAPDALPGMCRFLEEHADLAGVFGAYDHFPPERNFMSQYRNLSHAYVHETGSARASTFWAGLGALRREAFQNVGGFDERFRRPSVEDIDLGYRLVAAGYALRLDPRFRGRHLRHWSLCGSIVTDIRARGIPWTQLICRAGSVSNDLNTSIGLRLSVVLACAGAGALALAPMAPWAALASAILFGCLIGLNLPYYRWLAGKRGWLFAVRTVPAHALHHLCNGVSLVAGTALHMAARLGVHLPGALPLDAWTAKPPAGGHVVPDAIVK